MTRSAITVALRCWTIRRVVILSGSPAWIRTRTAGRSVPRSLPRLACVDTVASGLRSAHGAHGAIQRAFTKAPESRDVGIMSRFDDHCRLWRTIDDARSNSPLTPDQRRQYRE